MKVLFRVLKSACNLQDQHASRPAVTCVLAFHTRISTSLSASNPCVGSGTGNGRKILKGPMCPLVGFRSKQSPRPLASTPGGLGWASNLTFPPHVPMG